MKFHKSTLFKFLCLLILLHLAECTIEYYNTKLDEKPKLRIEPNSYRGNTDSIHYYRTQNKGLIYMK